MIPRRFMRDLFAAWVGAAIMCGAWILYVEPWEWAPLPEVPGELAKTPGGGIISYHRIRDENDWSSEPMQPWCFVVRQIATTNPDYPHKNRGNLVFAKACGDPVELPIR